MAFATVSELLNIGKDGDPALGAPETKALTYAGLRALAAKTIADLNAMGIGRDDRVAIVLPNGPEMAAAFLCVAAGATTAPLNPAYRQEEFEFYIQDLKSKALLVQAGDETPARAAAAKLGVPVIELTPTRDHGAGSYVLTATLKGTAAKPGPAGTDDIALILHTSGTTSRPKIVPLAQANICASARHIGATLALGAGDKCLNIMPLFHIHGLIAAVLSSLGAGGCTAILSRAERNKDSLAKARLRFIRSSSASLPPQVMLEVEKAFGCPVIESYGMTEAAHQMASNPLPPRERKPGSVGIAAGPEIAIMDEEGHLLAQGALGEVVIRGPNVTKGYEANPDANLKAFAGGWFRTGDQGTLDEGGYLRITGRLKELINRGGEKVSPLEVDEIIMDHPAVAQVVTFAMPHDKLGEEVAAAIVLREGQTTTEREIRDFAAKKLADFKVPRKVVILAEIPKGATGKLQRIGLAEKLGLGK
jgi:acyl-CoA synthetase (AMP-forming)/AMP-acid ligase II